MHRHSQSGRFPNPDVFSDDYSLDPIDAEESHHVHRDPSISSTGSSMTLYSHRLAQDHPNHAANERDSLENPFGDAARVSFDETPHRSSLPQKGANRNSLASSINTTPSIAQRSQSSSSRFSLPPRALSPYTGATGPSHPYAMYPQVGVGRSPSVTTTSSVRPLERPLGDLNGPQHPYAMYPQNVVAEEAMDDPVIPVGFPGHSQPYQRAPGRADDDVADIIGPDGHTEQLPPYSRYPDGVVPKPEGESEPGNDAGIAAEEDHPSGYEGPPASGTSSRTLVSERPTTENRQPPVVPAAAADATVFNEKAQGRSRRRTCCGMPIWTIVLIAVVMVICAVIGGVIGGVLGAKKATDEDHANETSPVVVTVTATPGIDATPMSTIPQGLPPLPTGQFTVPVSTQNMSRFCVADSGSKDSWDCMAQDNLLIEVGGSDSPPTITFQNQSISGPFTYGAQPPYFNNPTRSLTLMRDTNDLSLGPALFFYSLVDKLVIVREDTFPTAPTSKRAIINKDALGRTRYHEQLARAGDRPWFCWWNSTIMEFFLYLNETTVESQELASSTLARYPTFGPDSSKMNGYLLSNYPRRIKIEEKRNYPGAKQPYCQQMQVLDNGYIAPISTNTINIHEVEPTPTTTVIGYVGDPPVQTYTARAYYGSQCYCVSLTD